MATGHDTRQPGPKYAAVVWLRRTSTATIVSVAAAAGCFVLGALGYSPLAALLWPLWFCRYIFAFVGAAVGGLVYLFAESVLLARLNEALYTVDEHGTPNGPPDHQHSACRNGLMSRTAFAIAA